jgi:hypothetical protein
LHRGFQRGKRKAEPPEEKRGSGKKKYFGRKAAVLVLLLSVGFGFSPLFPFVRSLLVMGIYSKTEERKSLLEEQGISLRIPGGWRTKQADWYPFVMTFVADEAYAAYTGEADAKLTILYNFPAFSYLRGCSRLYDAQSPYYNSFYGAYLVQDSGNLALAEGKLDAERVAQIAEFDFFRLVLREFGLTREQSVFTFSVTDRQEQVAYAGREGWTKITAELTVNGSAHQKRSGVTSYLQYGAPGFGTAGQEFEPVSMSGIVYGQYFPEWDVGIYFYVMGERQICLDCDEQILSESVLESEGIAL